MHLLFHCCDRLQDTADYGPQRDKPHPGAAVTFARVSRRDKLKPERSRRTTQTPDNQGRKDQQDDTVTNGQKFPTLAFREKLMSEKMPINESSAVHFRPSPEHPNAVCHDLFAYHRACSPGCFKCACSRWHTRNPPMRETVLRFGQLCRIRRAFRS